MAEGSGTGSGRAYSGSGSGGNVVSYQDLEKLDVDHYDFINAPQYVDFSDLSKTDDPNADLFFETHREEDDFLISIDNISPTVQLLQEQQNLQQEMSKEGMDDVQVVYYASPRTTGSGGGVKGGSGSSNSTSTFSSFHTPVGGEEEKENAAPVYENITPELGKKLGAEPVKKLSYSAAFGNSPNNGNYVKTESYEKTLTIATPTNGNFANNENYEKDLKTPTPTDENYGGIENYEDVKYFTIPINESKNENYKKDLSTPTPPKTFLTAQFQQLQILSSSEDEAGDEHEISSSTNSISIKEENYSSPTKSIPDDDDDSLIESILKTPGAAAAASKLKARSFFSGLSIVTPSPAQSQFEMALKAPTIPESSPSDEYFKNEFPVFDGPSLGDENGSDRKMSMLVEPSVGQEVVWSNTETESEVNEIETHSHNTTLVSSVEKYHISSGGLAFDVELPQQNEKLGPEQKRRASSLSDLTSVLKLKNFKPLPKIEKLTIPHSPNASKRFRKEESTTTKFGRNVKVSSLQKPKITVPYVGKDSRGLHSAAAPRVPLKGNAMTFAESMQKFQKNTPDRFRTLPRNKIKRSTSQQELRAPDAASSSPTGAQGLVRCRAGSFRGQKATIPQPFHFASIRARPATAVEKPDEFKFKARPAPKTTSALHERPTVKVTIPMAPHFASDDRLRERAAKKIQSASHSPTGSRPVSGIPTATRPRTRVPSGAARPPLVNPEPPKTTVPKPFSFAQRDAQMLKKKEEKIKQEIEEEMKIPEFHANPLPSFEPKLPKKKPAPLTHLQPFKLAADCRGAAYHAALKKKLEDEERRLRELATFHANPPHVLFTPPFEPEHPPRPPLEQLDIVLYTEKRAVEREQFDNHLRQKEAECEMMKMKEQAELEARERQQNLVFRRQIVHKAQPFKEPKPFELKPSKKPLTIPQSPAFHPLPSQRKTTPTKNTSIEWVEEAFIFASLFILSQILRGLERTAKVFHMFCKFIVDNFNRGFG